MLLFFSMFPCSYIFVSQTEQLAFLESQEVHLMFWMQKKLLDLEYGCFV